jgi:hypothetical protein
MDEMQIIRQQLAVERRHLAAVAQACASALQGANTPTPASGPTLAQFQEACTQYLGCVLDWYQQRDARLQRLAAGLEPADPRCSPVHEILARSGGGGEALAQLAAAAADPAAWNRFVQFLSGPWSGRRDALEQLLANDSRAADWRRISAIDADGILEERARFSRVAALVPAGVVLGASGTRAV